MRSPIVRLALVTALVLSGACTRNEVRVTLRIVEAGSGTPTQARLEVMDSEARPHVATNGIPVTRECLLAPPPEWLAPMQTSPGIYNPYTGTTQFYADGSADLSLPPGSYRVQASKGHEWRRADQVVEVVPGEPGERQEFTIELARWVDPAARGWYGVDDHLHITRAHPDQNHHIARWMRAEGLHIANLLEMGTAAQFGVTPQYAYGDAGAYRDGPLLLLAGEEHPRTHFLGHTITLGTEERVDRRDEYIVYESTFAEGARLGGVSGFAHWGMRHAQDGLAINAPTGLVRFMEVLQFEYPSYDVWYQLLNLGFRIAPSAGTDFPCGPPTLPGRERFYVQIPGEVTRASFVAAVRAGRTFVTNGPMAELSVAGAGPGGEVQLEGPGVVSVTGRVRFDPGQDRVDAVDLIVNGIVVETWSETAVSGLFEIERELAIERSSWVALRSTGIKPADRGPAPLTFGEPLTRLVDGYVAGGGGPEMLAFRSGMTVRVSSAHTAAVFVNVKGSVPAFANGAALPKAWIARLDELESLLSDERIEEIPIQDWIPYSDGVSLGHLQRHQPALLKAIAKARVYYQELAGEGN